MIDEEQVFTFWASLYQNHSSRSTFNGVIGIEFEMSELYKIMPKITVEEPFPLNYASFWKREKVASSRRQTEFKYVKFLELAAPE